jgi:hypothetical protein
MNSNSKFEVVTHTKTYTLPPKLKSLFTITLTTFPPKQVKHIIWPKHAAIE